MSQLLERLPRPFGARPNVTQRHGSQGLERKDAIFSVAQTGSPRLVLGSRSWRWKSPDVWFSKRCRSFG